MSSSTSRAAGRPLVTQLSTTGRRGSIAFSFLTPRCVVIEVMVTMPKSKVAQRRQERGKTARQLQLAKRVTSAQERKDKERKRHQTPRRGKKKTINSRGYGARNADWKEEETDERYIITGWNSVGGARVLPHPHVLCIFFIVSKSERNFKRVFLKTKNL